MIGMYSWAYNALTKPRLLDAHSNSVSADIDAPMQGSGQGTVIIEAIFCGLCYRNLVS